MSEMTTDQVRTAFLDHVRLMVEYWAHQNVGEREKLEGVAFSLLVAIDGDASLPRFILAPDPHPEDKAFLVAEGEDYYPENHAVTVAANIAGALHEHLFRRTPSPGGAAHG